MNLNELIKSVSDYERRTGESLRSIALRAGIPPRTLNGMMKNNHAPSIERVKKICDAIGLQMFASGNLVEVSAQDTVTDPRLATMIAVLADAYEEAVPLTRQDLEIRFWAHFPDLKERERSLERVVAWLGWRAIN